MEGTGAGAEVELKVSECGGDDEVLEGDGASIGSLEGAGAGVGVD